MGYSDAAWGKAMKLQEVILQAMSGKIHWFRAAEILGMSPRTLRRYRMGLDTWGYDGLFDRRRRTPSPKRAPVEEVERILQLYRERYAGWNIRHFHETVRREHKVTLSYTFVKRALQAAGLAKKRKSRGRHRRRRERRACFGEMLHIDGSRHCWLGGDDLQSLITVVDDATSRVLYAQLWPAESTEAILAALHEVVGTHGIPTSLYTDRASWAFETPKAGMRVSKTVLTQVGEVLKRLGVEHIPSYSPQGRGRSERMNGTLQGRLVNELKTAGIKTIKGANTFIRRTYLKRHNKSFSCDARDPANAFVPLTDMTALSELFAREMIRQVGRDNVVKADGIVLQLAAQPGRRSCSGLSVVVKQHFNGVWSVHRGTQVLGRYDAKGRPTDPAPNNTKRSRRSGAAAVVAANL
jgi:transposase